MCVCLGVMQEIHRTELAYLKISVVATSAFAVAEVAAPPTEWA